MTSSSENGGKQKVDKEKSEVRSTVHVQRVGFQSVELRNLVGVFLFTKSLSISFSLPVLSFNFQNFKTRYLAAQLR
jgi:hypothetical protein